MMNDIIKIDFEDNYGGIGDYRMTIADDNPFTMYVKNMTTGEVSIVDVLQLILNEMPVVE
jgi:hypothetical protein